jgi:uncharacterized protein (TIGR01777 family)
MKILISGASGFVGQALVSALRAEGHTVARMVRPGGEVSPGDVSWDPMSATSDVSAMEGADAVVNLSGASIAGGRWTQERKATLRSSRIGCTRVLVDTLLQLQRKPRVFLSASATGYYGDRAGELLTEASSPGTDFLALLARDWEGEAVRAEHGGIRTVILRFGIILSAHGGALPKMLLPFKFGAGGRFGSGQQWMSWIGLEDSIGIIRAALTDERLSGPVNVVAPHPLQNLEFTRIVAAAVRRPAIFPAPAFALRLLLGEMAGPLLLASQRVVPERLLSLGYSFRCDDFASTLRALLPTHR